MAMGTLGPDKTWTFFSNKHAYTNLVFIGRHREYFVLLLTHEVMGKRENSVSLGSIMKNRFKLQKLQKWSITGTKKMHCRFFI